jgi:release factor glutamine methyltransferase
MSLIYEPAEDSHLLEKIILEKIPILIEKNPNLKFLEIGCGSGIQLKAAERAGIKKGNIFGVDINPDAVKHCRKLGFKCIRSDLFQFVDEKFDIIVFNPPYLPEDENHEDEESKIITTGGKMGSEVPNEFLTQTKDYLNKGGQIYLLVSSLTRGMDYSGYEKKLVSEEKLFFEKLYVYELSL